MNLPIRLFRAVSLLALLAAAPTLAQDSTDPDRRPLERELMMSESFLAAHPDLKYRLSGLERHAQGQWARALEDFRRAARYGDKPSQGMLGEMHWKGEGVPVDRATGYAWMDIAAERGYPVLIAKREQYWNALDETERARAVAVGRPLLDEFGDTVAKPRLERLLKRERRNLTGSRVGSVGNLTIMIPTPGGMRQIRGSTFYQDKFWKPEQYWRWQDYDWKKPPQGDVSVGEVLTDEDAPPAE